MVEAQYQAGAILAGRKEFGEAIAHYREVVRVKPDWVEALNNLAWLLATQSNDKLRNGEEAVRLATRAVELTQTNNVGTMDTLAAAYAEAGRFVDAVKTGQHAVAMANAASQTVQSAQIAARVKSYQSGKPWRER